MSDDLFAGVVTVGLCAALAGWVPALDFIRRAIEKRRLDGTK
jgi:hypothetical protein